MTTADPVATAWQWLDTQLKGAPLPRVLAVIGMGDGTLLEALDRHAAPTRVLALEPDPVAAHGFLSRRNWQHWTGSGRLVYLTGPAYVGADEAWRIFPTGVTDPTVLIHTVTAGTPDAARVLKQIVFGVKANDVARRRFAPRYLVNSIRNLPAMIAGSDVRALAGALTGMPAIIAAAGPSLDAVVGDLHTYADRALLIAADTALRPLLAAGVAPPIVAGLDPSAANARHLLSLPECRDTWLVSESALDRHATAAFEGRTFWFRAAHHHPWPWFNELGIDVGRLDVWGSVLTGAFELACLAGCDPIVIVGADLSYTHDRPYARNTTYELDWLRAAAAGTPLEEVWGWSVSGPDAVRANDLRGVDTATSAWLLSFRDWMVAHAKRSGRRVVNATGAGMLFGDGLEQATLAETLPARVALPPIATLARRLPGIRPSAVAARLRALREALGKDGTAAAPLTQWAEFSGDGFDPGDVGAALDEAAYTLETRRGIPAAASSMPWPPVASAAIRDAFSQLPEAMARFRAVLSHHVLPALATHTLTSPATLLTHAADAYDYVRSAALREDEPALLANPHTEPISTAYAWPDATRRAIEVFEALLGKAWPAAAPSQSPYFTRTTSIRFASLAAPAPGSRINAVHACTLLALQWARCAENIEGAPADVVRDRAVTLPAGVGEPVIARALTGGLGDRTTVLRRRGLALPGAPQTAPVATGLTVRPRALTDTWGRRAFVGYPTTDGVVTLAPQALESTVVNRDGRAAPHFVWPRPILGELPFGDDGAVAWGNGLSKWPDVEDGYVMYRPHRTDSVTVETLSIRPTIGTWWNGRLYWNCYPTPTPSWVGVASWAPGEGARAEIPDITLFGMDAANDGLLLAPCRFRPMVGWERGGYDHGWRWRPEQPLIPLPFDPPGVASARATSNGWTATAHPDADLVRFESADGRSVSMICYFPLRLAWIGSTLVVSTAECELLMFDDVRSTLDRLGASAP